MRLIDADAILAKMEEQAGCKTCQNYNGAKCAACTWDDAWTLVDDYADNHEAPKELAVPAMWIYTYIGRFKEGTAERNAIVNMFTAWMEEEKKDGA